MKPKLLRLLTLILILVLMLGFVAPAASAMTMPFVDVPQGAWFYDAVAWAHAHGIAAGTSATTFSPHNNVTRGQFVVFLHRIAGGNRVEERIRFHDVTNPSQFFFHAVNWASDNGIVSGVGDGSNFMPNRHITREEMAVIMFRFARFQGRNTAAPESALLVFSDRQNISTYAREGMRWAAHTGILRGNQSGPQNLQRIHPGNFATRAETITIIQRYILETPFTPPQPLNPPLPPDNSHTIRHCHRNGFPSSHRWTGRSGWVPDIIVMHTTVGSAQSAIDWSFNSNPRVSYHFVIDQHGTITQIVPITDTAWANGTAVNGGSTCFSRASHPVVRSRPTNANYYTVSIGFGDAGGNAAWGWGRLTNEQIRAGVWLVEHIRFEVWRNYGEIIPVNRSTVIGHNEINNTACPGTNFPFDPIINNVRR